MDKLRELLEAAQHENNATATAEFRGVAVEYNGGVPIYTIHGAECTATEAMDRLDELNA